MADRYHNPFAGKEIHVPLEYHEAVQRYSQKQGNPLIDESPFPRMIDFWFLSVCVACRLGLDPADTTKYKTVKIADGSIFGNDDSWRIHMLMLIAISRSDGVNIVSEPNRMLSIANALAKVGIPEVIAMLKNGNAEPIWNLSDAIDSLLRKEKSV